MAGVQLLHSLIYLQDSSGECTTRWGSTLTLPDILVLLTHVFRSQLGFNSYTP